MKIILIKVVKAKNNPTDWLGYKRSGKFTAL